MNLRAFVAIFSVAFVVNVSAENWPQWRGPSLNGISSETNLPMTWSPNRIGGMRGPSCPIGSSP